MFMEVDKQLHGGYEGIFRKIMRKLRVWKAVLGFGQYPKKGLGPGQNLHF